MASLFFHTTLSLSTNNKHKNKKADNGNVSLHLSVFDNAKIVTVLNYPNIFVNIFNFFSVFINSLKLN